MTKQTAIRIIEIDAKIEMLYQLKKFNEAETYKKIKSKIYNEANNLRTSSQQK